MPPDDAASGASAGSALPGGAAAVLYYDGACGVCRRSVAWLAWADRRGALRFAPLQGETARARLPAGLREPLDTVVLEDAAGLWVRSAAMLRAARLAGGSWGAAAALGCLVPRRLRDAAYDAFAARRGRFARLALHRLPTPAEDPRFLP